MKYEILQECKISTEFSEWESLKMAKNTPLTSTTCWRRNLALGGGGNPIGLEPSGWIPPPHGREEKPPVSIFSIWQSENLQEKLSFFSVSFLHTAINSNSVHLHLLDVSRHCQQRRVTLVWGGGSCFLDSFTLNGTEMKSKIRANSQRYFCVSL